ncbi:type II toxin-antitoxin system HipA family toxin [Streptomyces acidiscabies]|uniref:type II toxin-antitoxin system HipA family toxin n=1 Tax=Streptomyces acidiscabies TaxID=42234 RepID=UPI0018FE2D38|nr:HipA domain-containing protein [Streptomyces acidiscabies]
MREVQHAVWLRNRHVGVLHQRGDYTRLTFDVSYRDDPERPVLGLYFEETVLAPQSSALRIPPWFSNLLPEGRVRDWVAEDRGVSVDREMELLAHVGRDLPGAVRIMPIGLQPVEESMSWEHSDNQDLLPEPSETESHPGWRISLAGVQLKFAMLSKDDRLTIPGFGEGSDWIVKLPDRQFRMLPQNEFAMMTLARGAGIDVPEIKLVHRDQLSGIPANVWPGDEEWVYAVKRFDRGPQRRLIHIEDLAQVRNFYPRDKYRGNFETIASLIYRQHDIHALREFARRMAFIILTSNGDAHLKNWSLIYRDERIPTLSPAYDLVSTDIYRAGDDQEDLGLSFGGSRHFDRVSLRAFQRLERRLNATEANLTDIVTETVELVRQNWPEVAKSLTLPPGLAQYLGKTIEARSKTLLRS